VKTVFDAKTGELLGAHMIGAEVTELIQGYTVGKTAELVEAISCKPSSRIRP
jgi:dihydrolipoamide dehydrogenase